MKALVIRRPGGYSELGMEERPVPDAGPEDVLIHVSHAGVNYADCLVRMGLYKSAKDYGGYPIVPGFDFAGTVQRAGNGAGFKPGEKVFGVTRFGAYQNDIAVHKDYLLRVPEGLSLPVAASLPTAFLTAFHMLHELAHIRTGEKLLVRSAGGGVGSWLSILGARAGADVRGIVSTVEKKEALGNPSHIMVGEPDFCLSFDVIANALGGRSIAADLKRLKPEGRLILYGFHGLIRPTRNGRIGAFGWLNIAAEVLRMPRFKPFDLVNQNKSVMGCNLSYLFGKRERYQAAMRELLVIIAEGTKLPPVTILPFEEAAEAHRRLESGRTFGKMVLEL